MFKIKRYLVLWLIAATCLISTGAHAADSYPDKHVKLVVPYPAGGTTDLIARLYAERLSGELKQPVIIENKGGAATNIGSGIDLPRSWLAVGQNSSTGHIEWSD